MFKEIIAAFVEYKYLSLAFFASLVLLAFLVYKASVALSRTNRKRDEVFARMRQERELLEEFDSLTREKALTSTPERLIRGGALSVQKALEKSQDMTAAFGALTKQQQYVYAVNYVFFEDAETLSEFFRKNGKPLTTAARDAFNEVVGGEAASVFSDAFEMFDEDNESVSVTEEKVRSLDEAFKKISEKDGALLSPFSGFIVEHLEAFSR